MAGYKQICIDDDAASMWTFDGDNYESGTRKLLTTIGGPNVIIDEIDNLNPAILHSDHEDYLGYRMGGQSLVAHEQTDQHSISFGYYGEIPEHPNNFPMSYLEIQHTTTYSFPHLGSFSVELLFNKTQNSDAGTAGNNWSKPIISKSGVFNIYFTDYNYEPTQIRVIHPGGSIQAGSYPAINMQSFKAGNESLFNRTIHLVLTWNVIDLLNGNYKGIACVYINSYLASEQQYNYSDYFPNTNISTPILIAGTGSNNPLSDFHTSNFIIDQISIYDKALTKNQVANHFTKIYPYDEMIRHTFASNYWTFGDIDSTIYYKIDPYIGTLKGDYIGGRAKIQRGVPGPPNITAGSAASFTKGSQAVFLNTSYSTYIPRSITNPYTYELWFKVTSSKRAILLSIQQLIYPFNGISIQLNVRNNVEVIGSLQFTESNSDDAPIFNSLFLDSNQKRLMYNDGKWHFMVITRHSSGLVEFWLDGILHYSTITGTITIGHPGQICMMNSLPGNLYCEGSLSKFAYYDYALQPQQIQSHYTYSITYRIRGIVTLLGIPYKALLRFYSSATGELLQELESDANTGEYMAIFENNSNVDILVSNPADLSVRYRAYGPVTPSEFDDLPITIG